MMKTEIWDSFLPVIDGNLRGKHFQLQKRFPVMKATRLTGAIVYTIKPDS